MISPKLKPIADLFRMDEDVFMRKYNNQPLFRATVLSILNGAKEAEIIPQLLYIIEEQQAQIKRLLENYRVFNPIIIDHWNKIG